MMHRETELFQLFGGYLNEDFPDDYGTWENGVRAYARENEPERVRFVRQVFAAARDSSNPEGATQAIFNEARHSLPIPPYGFPTSREWLVRAILLLDEGLAQQTQAKQGNERLPARTGPS